MFSQKPNCLRECVPSTSTTFDNYFRQFFDQEEGTENFAKFRQKELTKVVEVAGPHSGKEISFMFLFQQPRLENEKKVFLCLSMAVVNVNDRACCNLIDQYLSR